MIVTRPKEPVATEAAGLATEQGDESNQFDLFDPPLSPAAGSAAAARSASCRSDRCRVPAADEGDELGSVMNAPERKPVRRKRIDTPVRVVPLKRAIAAAAKAGLSVNSIEVRLDGTIVLLTGQPVAAPQAPADVFAQWADRL